MFGIAAWLGACEGSGASDADAEAPWFVDVAPERGLVSRHDSGGPGLLFEPEIMGPGAALLDVEGDGDLDVYLVRGALPERCDASANRLFTQRDDGRFDDATDGSGLDDRGYAMGCAVGDVEGDGDPDVYVTNVGADAFLRAEAPGRFADRTREAGLDNDRWACSAAFGDVEGDGDLDLYVANYLDVDDPRECRDLAGRRDYCGPAPYAGVADRLFVNDGHGAFTDVSARAGLTAVRGKGLGVTFVDFDGDGRVEIYVANDGEPNHLWTLGSDGRLLDRAFERGCAVNGLGRSEASMGVAVGDVDLDGDLDLWMTHLVGESNTLYLNDGVVGFRDGTQVSGAAAGSLSSTGFGVALVDFDADGWLDLAVANGRVSRGEGTGGHWTRYAEPDLYLRGTGPARWEPRPGAVAEPWLGIGRGLCTGDVDRDGDVDLLLTDCNGAVRLLDGVAPRRGHWTRLRPRIGARAGVGATLHVTAGGVTRAALCSRAGSYGSSSEPVVHLGVGASPRVDEVLVIWPDGARERFGPFEVDAEHVLQRGEGRD